MAKWGLVLLQLSSRSLVTSIIVLALLSVSYAQVRSSSNYQIQSDSLNLGGGYSSSTNYTQESTMGEIATGRSESSGYKLQAGYQQMQEVFISLSGAADVVMSPSINGLDGGESNGSTTVTVITDSAGGYQLSITTEGEPAMQSGSYSIADYVGAPDYDFTYGAAEAFFGFSPEGVDVVSAFLDDGGSNCNQVGGTEVHLQCWDGLSTTSVPIATGTGSNHPLGATTTIQFRVGVGNVSGLTAGDYVATTTLTAIAL